MTDMAFLRKTRNEGIGLFHLGYRQQLRCLRGLTRGRNRFDDDEFQEAEFLAAARAVPPAHCLYQIRRLQTSVVFRDVTEARAQADEAARRISVLGDYLPVFDFTFHSALAAAATWDTASDTEREQLVDEISARRDALARWADTCPASFLHPAVLVEAELARVRGQDAAATDCYERAVELASVAGARQDRALASELAARHALARGRSRIGTCCCARRGTRTRSGARPRSSGP